MTSAVNMAETTSDPDAMFPDPGMRTLGAVQINIGVLVFVLGVVDLVLTMTSHDSDLKSYGSHYETVVTMTVVASPLWGGLWFSISGALAACFTFGRPTTVLYSKVALLVTSLLCCALFGPACAVINGFISYTRHNLAKGDYQWLISVIICFLAVIEVVMATVTASVTCCCSTFRPTQVHVFVNPRKLSSSGSDVSAVTASSTASDKLDKNLSHLDVSNFSRNNTSNRINLINNRNTTAAPVVISREFKDGWTQVAKVSTRTANVGTSENNFVQQTEQTPVKETNVLTQKSNPPMVKDSLQPLAQTSLTPVEETNILTQKSNPPMVKDSLQPLAQTSLTPVNITDADGSLPHLRHTPIKSVGEYHSSQLSNRSVQEVIMRTPTHWISRAPDTKLNIQSLDQHFMDSSVKTAQSDQPSRLSNKTGVTDARESLPTQQMQWTPDRHLRNLPPSLETRPASTEEILRDLEHASSYKTLKKWTLPL